MEGIYFFGEYQRWNLGWNNPNQAGVFVAMWIPWLWGFSAIALRIGGRWRLAEWSALVLEAGLWFLLCKTYSRGALVAVVAAAALFVLMEWLRGERPRLLKMVSVRLVMVFVLLLATGFFDRIAPGYVAQDASAGNRLTLWRGGVRMIAVSPWTGWGVGQSGPAFMHWFQPLEAKEAYAGMVNSYLHVAVERGLPVLVVCLALAGCIIIPGLLAAKNALLVRCGNKVAGMGDLVLAAVCVLTVFLVANFFSTLWSYRNLWWGPGIAAVLIIVLLIPGFGRCGLRRMMWSLGGAVTASCGIAGLQVVIGKAEIGGPMISRLRDGTILCAGERGNGGAVVEFLADESTLGETWGKELRRLASARRDLVIRVPPRGGMGEVHSECGQVEWVVACGHRVSDGFAALEKRPQARLVLVNPTGRELQSATNVQVLLPGLDTSRVGVFWKAACRRSGWKCSTIPGVGQDIRLAWPAVLETAIPRKGGGFLPAGGHEP